ncbi:MAG: 3'(2'),5'-bisphosphate nucleotidase CysQ [Pseudomonadota bacterium]
MTETADANDRKICDALRGVALAAGAEIMAIYRTDFSIDEKADASPVTEADGRAEAIIIAGLNELSPATPILAEEAASAGHAPALGDEFFLVDPLDGTREFINRNGEFTVNIALIRNGAPVIGVVYAPAAGRLYEGVVGDGARRYDVDEKWRCGPPTPIQTADNCPRPRAVASRSHRSPETDAFLKDNDCDDCVSAGSSLKFCLIAEGAAHLYPRFGRTMEWDTGAGQAVLEAAGGRVRVYPSGEPLRYNKRDRGFDNPHFIASCE